MVKPCSVCREPTEGRSITRTDRPGRYRLSICPVCYRLRNRAHGLKTKCAKLQFEIDHFRKRMVVYRQRLLARQDQMLDKLARALSEIEARSKQQFTHEAPQATASVREEARSVSAAMP